MDPPNGQKTAFPRVLIRVRYTYNRYIRNLNFGTNDDSQEAITRNDKEYKSGVLGNASYAITTSQLSKCLYYLHKHLIHFCIYFHCCI